MRRCGHEAGIGAMEIHVERLVPRKVIKELADERIKALAEILSPRDPRPAREVVARARRAREHEAIDSASVVDRARIRKRERERKAAEKDHREYQIERIIRPDRAAALVRRYIDKKVLKLTPHERRLLRKDVRTIS